jgi:iron-sulfur cluster assembly protein
MARKPLISLTDRAVDEIKNLLAKRQKCPLGIRVAIKSSGCSGFKYLIEYADDKQQFDEVFTDKGVTILIDPKALMYLIGAEMDYVEEQFKSGFIFTNPNEKGKCGCGKSFSI